MSTGQKVTLRIAKERVDAHTNECELCFEVLTSLNRWVPVMVPRSEVTYPHKVQQRLAAMGWIDAFDLKSAKDAISHAVQAANWPVERVTGRTGWHGSNAFVLQHRTIGSDEGTLIFYPPQNAPIQRPEGLSVAWSMGLADAFAASSYLTFASALAMAGALIKPLKVGEGAIFQLTGKSSTGKTMTLRLAQSALGKAGHSTLISHDLTERALEEHLGAANDGLLCLDELARLQGTPSRKREYIQTLPHVLASGQGRRRSKTVEKNGLEHQAFRVMGLSTGENALESYGERDEGERVRFPDILVSSTENDGIFDRLKGGDARKLAAEVEATIEINYGRAYAAFIEKLVANREEATQNAKKHLHKFVEKVAPDGNSWDLRFARKFGLVYAAAALASDWKILPFSRTHARNSIVRLHRKARIEARTAEEAKNAITSWLGKDAQTHHFPLLKKGEPLPGKASVWGFRRKYGEETRLMVDPQKLKSKVKPERHQKAVLSLLADEWVLIKERDDRYESQVEVPGRQTKRSMFYCFDMRKLP